MIGDPLFWKGQLERKKGGEKSMVKKSGRAEVSAGEERMTIAHDDGKKKVNGIKGRGQAL